MLLAVYLMQRQLEGIDFGLFRTTIKLWHAVNFEMALGLTFFSFFIFSGYDALGIWHSRRRLPYFTILHTSFAAFSISNIVGHSIFTGSTVRFKTYRAGGLTISHVAQIALLNSLTFWLGYSMLLGICLIAAPLPRGLSLLSSTTAPALGTALLLACLAYFGACWKWAGQDLRFKRFVLNVPRPRVAALQMLLGCLDVTVAAAILYALLPASMELGFSSFFIFYLFAQALGVLSQVPGGLGVLDGLLLSFLRPFADPHQLIVAIILFRLCYYLLPLALTISAKLLFGAWRHRTRLCTSSRSPD